MNVLVFDRNIKTLLNICNKFKDNGVKVIEAENGTKFISSFFNKNIDMIVMCKNELEHYNETEHKILKRNKNVLVLCSYNHSENSKIKDVRVCSRKKFRYTYKLKVCKTILKIVIGSFVDNTDSRSNLLKKLPKKTALLFEFMLANKTKGVTKNEISKLFWGTDYMEKSGAIYNQVYNLRKVINENFKNKFVIYTNHDKYHLVELEKDV